MCELYPIKVQFLNSENESELTLRALWFWYILKVQFFTIIFEKVILIMTYSFYSKYEFSTIIEFCLLLLESNTVPGLYIAVISFRVREAP